MARILTPKELNSLTKKDIVENIRELCERDINKYGCSSLFIGYSSLNKDDLIKFYKKEVKKISTQSPVIRKLTKKPPKKVVKEPDIEVKSQPNIQVIVVNSSPQLPQTNNVVEEILQKPKAKVVRKSQTTQQFVYIMQLAANVKFKNNVYKFGMSNDPNRRVGEYDPGAEIKFSLQVENMRLVERECLNKFKEDKNNFEQILNEGNETFKGDLNKMIQVIMQVVDNSKSESKENKKCSSTIVNGDPCSKSVIEGKMYCNIHQHKQNAVNTILV